MGYRHRRAVALPAVLALVVALATACSGRSSESTDCAIPWKAGATLPSNFGQCVHGFATGMKTTKYRCHGSVSVVVLHLPRMWAIPGQPIHLVSGRPLWRDPRLEHVLSNCEVPTDF